MSNFLRYLSIHNISMALALGSFAPVAAFPQPNHQFQNGLNDVAAGVRIGKLLESAKRNFEKGNVKKLIKNMLDLIWTFDKFMMLCNFLIFDKCSTRCIEPCPISMTQNSRFFGI